ncbi:hypothetical protein AXF42_Ash011727 [Apostasia shenzhenica]|uniref:SWIM-type domain-containing protein n=1 Tax=Apostasia shenzhenica TaxID=1088818 RepID=A0A2H9ZUU6_9ASPA|nr:hypothetical protein AXF42_Ash011727 [Apostasia shenzhenica]
MQQCSQLKKDMEKWKNLLVPSVVEQLREYNSFISDYNIKDASRTLEEVKGKGERHKVDLNKQECSCKEWQFTEIPCIHASAFIRDLNHVDWSLYVSEYFHVASYQRAYEGTIVVMTRKNQWYHANNFLSLNPPHTIRPRGRPRKSKFKNFLEKLKQATSKRKHKCGRCRLFGHHRNSCRNPINPFASQEYVSSTANNIGSTEASSSNSYHRKFQVQRG